jgi:ribonuclease P protein component
MDQHTFQLTTAMRLRRSQDFERTYADGLRAGDGHLLVFVVANGQPLTRAGLSVSRKHGSAVIRNRKRRLLREAFRLNQHRLPAGLDLILIPRFRADSTIHDYARSLVLLTRQLHSQISRKSDPPPF